MTFRRYAIEARAEDGSWYWVTWASTPRDALLKLDAQRAEWPEHAFRVRRNTSWREASRFPTAALYRRLKLTPEQVKAIATLQPVREYLIMSGAE